MKILIIGGGMSGLTYGIISAKNNQDVTIVERNQRVGKKISMTGNGKCNIGNEKVDISCYNGGQVVSAVLQDVTIDEYKKFLSTCGLETYSDDQGRMYPVCNNAPSVVDCLKYQYQKFGGKLILGTCVQSYCQTDKGYLVDFSDGTTQLFDKLVLACGSSAQAQNVQLLQFVDETYLTPIYPSLTPVVVKSKPVLLNGQRVKANVCLYHDGKAVASEFGEVLFRDYGLSGICIFNLSAIIARNNVQNKGGKYSFTVDLFPTMQLDQLAKLIQMRLDNYDADKLLYGLLPNVFSAYVQKRCSKIDATTVATLLKNMTFDFVSLCDYSMCQVVCGGVKQSAVDVDTLTLPNGVVVLGEALDVDGVCGGYNLYFASASALHTFDKSERSTAYGRL